MESAIKFKVQVSDEKKYNSVNVRSENGNVIGQIKNGARVTFIKECADPNRVVVEGTQMSARKKIKGSVLKSCLKKI